jgi:hypothetical protein
MSWCLRQLETHTAVRPLTWSVCQFDTNLPGAAPTAASARDEPPAELVKWAKQLNASDPLSIDFGVIDRGSVCNSICVMDGSDFIPVDSRGKWIAGVGFGHGASRPSGLGTAAAWRICPALAAMLDAHYGTDSKPLPPAPPKPKLPPTAAEKLDMARYELRHHAGNDVAVAIEKFIDAKAASPAQSGRPQ